MMIRMDKKSSKSYVIPVNVCHLLVLQPARVSESKNRVRDCLPDVYIAENAESLVWPTI